MRMLAPLLLVVPLWNADIGIQGAYNNPVVSGNIVYVSSYGTIWNEPDEADGVYAIGLSDGRILWHAHTASDANGITLLPGLLVAATDDGTVLGLDSSDGRVVFEHAAGARVYGISSDPSGRIFFGDASGVIRSIDTEGNILWSVDYYAPVRAAPLILPGALYVANLYGELIRLDPDDGSEVFTFSTTWRRGPGEDLAGREMAEEDSRSEALQCFGIYRAPVYSGGVIWFGTNYLSDFQVYAAGAGTGEMMGGWGNGLGWGGSSAVKAGVWASGDRMIYQDVPYMDDGHVYLTDPFADALIEVYEGGGWSTPASYGNDVVVVSESGLVRCIDPIDGTIVWSYDLGERVFSPPAIAGDIIIIGTDAGRLYGLRPAPVLEEDDEF